MNQSISRIGNFTRNNSPVILAILAGAGVVITAVLAARGGALALDVLNSEGHSKEYYTKREIVKLTWKCYLPAVASGLLTITAIVGGTRISQKRLGALATMYTLTEKIGREYQQKVIETLGEKKAETIKEEIMKDRVDDNPVSKRGIVNTGKGTTLMYDSMSGRYFYSDLETVRRIVNDFNKEILSSGLMTLNEFYDELGLPHVKIGEIIGWGTDFEFLDIEYRTMIADNGEPCIVLDYKVEPSAF